MTKVTEIKKEDEEEEEQVEQAQDVKLLGMDKHYALMGGVGLVVVCIACVFIMVEDRE